MISDTLFESIQEIERYQRDFRCYDDVAEDIETVKKLMAALLERLDHPFFEGPLDISRTLSPEQKELCESGQDAEIVKRIILEEFERRRANGESAAASQGGVIEQMLVRIHYTRLRNKAAETGRLTNSGEENVRRGAKKMFLESMRSLRDQFVVRRTGWIERR